MRKPRIDWTRRQEEISVLLRRLAFSQTALRLCADEGSASQEAFLLRVLESEAANREEVRKARYLREAGFPVYKTLEGYEYQNLRLPPTLSRADLACGSLIKDRKNLVLYGPVGTGETHLATALGVMACEHNIRTRFFTVAQLAVRLSEAYAGGSLKKTLATILKTELLILDEWGYVPIDKHGAQLLFRIISDSYERRSLVITTNMEFSKWGRSSTTTRWPRR